MTWFYNGTPFSAEMVEDDMVGFVYCITNLLTMKKYIGKKNLFREIVRPPLKGQKRKRRSKVQSDWQTYASSSEAVKEQVEAEGLDSFRRDILEICYSKGMLSYRELWHQMDRNVLFDESYLNGIIQVRINRKHLQTKALTNAKK